MEMEPKLMQGLMHLLEQALALSQWREAFGAGPVAVGGLCGRTATARGRDAASRVTLN